MKAIFTLLMSLCSVAVQSQFYVVDSLFGDQGMKLLSNDGYSYIPEISVFDDGDVYVQGRNHRIVFIFGIMEVIRSGAQWVDACGNLYPDYGVSGYWNIDGEPIYVEKSLMLDDKTLYAAGDRNVNLVSTPCLQKIDSVGNLVIQFESPSPAYFSNPGLALQWKYLDFSRDTILDKITCVGTYWYGSESGIFMSVFDEDGTRDLSSFSDGTRVIPIHLNESYVMNRRFKRSVQVDSDRFLLSASNSNGDSLIMAMVKRNGTLDSTFGVNGLLYDHTVLLNDGYTSILTTEKRLFQTEVIGEHIFVSTLESEGDSFRCYLRKYSFDGALDGSFGIGGKKHCFTYGSHNLDAFIMEKIGSDRLMLSALKFGQLPSEESILIVLDEYGNLVDDFPIPVNTLIYGNERLMVDRIYMEDTGTAYVLGSSYSGKLVLQKYRDVSLIPELILNGTELHSSVNSTDAYFEWYYNGMLLEGFHQGMIEVNFPGEYSVTVRSGEGCSAMFSDTLMIEFVGNQAPESSKFSISPNPCNDFVAVYSESLGSPLWIYDASGRLVFTDLLVEASKVIDVSALSNGMYFLKCGNTFKRFVVQKEQ